jgi:hypothetical protein
LLKLNNGVILKINKNGKIKLKKMVGGMGEFPPY